MPQKTDVIFFLFASSITIVIVVTGFVMFLSLFFRAKRKTHLEKQEAKLNFQKELVKVSEEIQIQTLNDIGRELHDNIGQLLVVSKIHAENLVEESPSETSRELTRIISQTLLEVRHLSQTLNSTRFEKFGFENTLKLEAERINKLKGVKFYINTKGDVTFYLDENRGLILFRIIQEFISNTLKHSCADKVEFDIECSSDAMLIVGKDNGQGFDINDRNSNFGAGLLNMKNRAELIGATLKIDSTPSVGTRIEIIIPKNISHEA